MDVEHTTMKNRINMDKRLSLNPESITYKAKENGARKGWKHTTQQIKDRLDINNQDMEGTRNLVKTNVREKTKAAFKESIDRNGAEKSKIQHLMNTKNNQWEPGKPAPYIMELTRMQASTIFKAKTRMLHGKENYKGNYQNRLDKLKPFWSTLKIYRGYFVYTKSHRCFFVYTKNYLLDFVYTKKTPVRFCVYKKIPA